MTVLKCLKSLWLKIRPYTSKRCCAVFLFIWDLLIQNPLRFLRNLNTGELWLQKSEKNALFCPFCLFSQTNKTNRTEATKFKSLLLRQKKALANASAFFNDVCLRQMMTATPNDVRYANDVCLAAHFTANIASLRVKRATSF